MNELDGPDPVRELMMQAELDADSQFKERVILLERQMALASLVILAVVLPPSKEEEEETLKMLKQSCILFIKRAAAYIAANPVAAKDQ